MYGYIYKITNTLNDHVYIGQVIAHKGIQRRFAQHIKLAESGANYKLSRAIRKYGKDNFTIESIDFANSKEELNQKEKYWIKYYNSLYAGYNMTPGGKGGNTYIQKTEAELKEIKQKIALKNHLHNGNHGQYIGEKNSMFGKHHVDATKKQISDKLKGRKKPDSHGKNVSRALKGMPKDYIPAVVKLYVKNVITNEIERLSAKEIVDKYAIQNYKQLKYIVDNQKLYQNTYLILKSVSTIPDECKGVESEISTDSKRTTT